MRILRAVTEADMVACFLRGELASARFGGDVRRAMAQCGCTEEMIAAPDTASAEQNRLRAQALNICRGYGRNEEIFEHWPERISWYECEFSESDIAKLRYIKYDYWDALSGGTSRPQDAAQAIKAGKTVFNVPNDGFIKAADALEQGAKFPPLIVLTSGNEMILLEGHQRATAYALTPGHLSGTRALAGICSAEALSRWNGGYDGRPPAA